MSAGWPNMCTTRMARVRGVIRRSTSTGSGHNVRGSRSQKTGVAPRLSNGVCVAQNVQVGVMTSAPRPMPSPYMAQ